MATGDPSRVEGPTEVAALADEREAPEEFEFFTREGERPKSATRPDLGKIASEPNPDTTLAQDLGVEDSEAPVKTDPPNAEPTQETTQESTRTAAKPTEPPVQESPVRVEPTPPAANPAATGSEGATDSDVGPFVIQVFSSRDEIQARRLLTRLQANGFQAILSPVEVGSDTMYRVRIGPFDQRPQAEAVASRARKELQVDTWITSPE
jgi:cell division septation protein DedD